MVSRDSILSLRYREHNLIELAKTFGGWTACRPRVFSVLSPGIGWQERLRNDLFCVGRKIDSCVTSVCDKQRLILRAHKRAEAPRCMTSSGRALSVQYGTRKCRIRRSRRATRRTKSTQKNIRDLPVSMFSRFRAAVSLRGTSKDGSS